MSSATTTIARVLLLLEAVSALVVVPLANSPPVPAVATVQAVVPVNGLDAAVVRQQVGVVPGIFPSGSMLIADAQMSPAKAKIEAAKRAQQEKLAERGYGDLAAAPKVAEAPKVPEKPKTFAELLQATVEQRESIAGKVDEAEYEKIKAKVRASYPGLE